ncbi:Uncharacterised protein [Yersinia frederiksenii]|jgi:hypothetical protein|uniref:Uncharacterized protein n=1 Tax=Yersinia frederiksenii TaxID=29484 RepID=A0AAI8ZRD4_YERFR|nr:Uncharacterised protein [Yersinia frederiksenii]CFR14226.1 Uncharacterised protein [Yersinia frederiksenii]CNG18791.1 Uncharacterised protein [Yersinia frederiksenii]CQH43465.1 Uncharacterised protein [Yersinia frederiksenii]CQI98408.1 Uncharacterised protein [Yersinia frederiksenii]
MSHHMLSHHGILSCRRVYLTPRKRDEIRIFFTHPENIEYSNLIEFDETIVNEI